MGDLIELCDARHRVRIAPATGGGIADAVALREGRSVPLLRPRGGAPTRAQNGAAVDALGLGCNVLVPSCNRVSGGGFAFEGAFRHLAPNVDIAPYPIHGDGWLAVWRVAEKSAQAVTLNHDGHFGPFDYTATLHYALDEGGILARLSVTNRGLRLPFGAGFHPWFQRLSGTRLRFQAAGVWTETEDYLPLRHLALSDHPDRSFCRSRALPQDFINAAFTGWPGAARIAQPGLGIEIDVTASPNLGIAHVYSPGPNAGFFCFEPVSHATDAANQPGLPGLTILDSGANMTVWMRIAWRAVEGADA